ncbi:MAG: ABC transporter substrate-binding protein [Dehalococcoidales bacterium]|jgi:iron complex transport system substrate-binding protein
MKRKLTLILIFAVLLLSLLLPSCAQQEQTSQPSTPAASSPATVEIIDMGGRTVTIPAPDKLERLYATGTHTDVFLYTLAPDKVTATPTTFDDEDKKFLSPLVYDLPNYGTLSGKGSLNFEAIKAGDVQVILSGSTQTITQSDIESADELQAQLEIPVVLFNLDMDNFAESYELLGRMLGREDDAKKLSDYCANIIETINAISAQVPLEDRPTLYYAEGADGLATEPAVSNRSIVFNKAGAINIAEVEALSGFGQASVSMEQVLNWNPEVIIVQSGGAYDKIITDANWANIDAVKNGRVYEMPSIPYSWADRPPSVNRFIGLYWMAYLLYPDLCDFDLIDVAQDYYKVMYHVDVSRGDIESLLVNSLPKK